MAKQTRKRPSNNERDSDEDIAKRPLTRRFLKEQKAREIVEGEPRRSKRDHQVRGGRWDCTVGTLVIESSILTFEVYGVSNSLFVSSGIPVALKDVYTLYSSNPERLGKGGKPSGTMLDYNFVVFIVPQRQFTRLMIF